MIANDSTCHVCGAVLDLERHAGRCAACVFAEAFQIPPEEGLLASIGGHDLIEEIARGGMGVVYRARQREPEREVALKTVLGAGLDSPEALARFRNEAEAMAALDHPAILPVYAFGEEAGVPFFTMKLATGGTLARRIGDYAGQWRTIAKLMADLADAVQFAHNRGVLHRDLKPGNILFDTTTQPFVSDFGLAKILGDATQLTQTQTMMGTPSYMAPELAVPGGRGATTASDVWALGVMLYELLAGHPPFRGDNVPVVLRLVVDAEPAPLPKTVPRHLRIITARALQKEPDERFGSAQEFADDLRRWMRNEPIRARPVSLPERLVLWARRKPAPATLTGVLGLTLIGSALLLVRSNENLRAVDRQRRGEVHRALVEKADAERQTLTPGHRERALALVREALAHGTSVRARSVAASALAVQDFRPVQRWTVTAVRRDVSLLRMTPDLATNIAMVPAERRRDATAKNGVLGLWRTADTALLAQIPISSPSGVEWPKLSPDAHWSAFVVKGHTLEVWDWRTEKLIRSFTSTRSVSADFHPRDNVLFAVLNGSLVKIALLDGAVTALAPADGNSSRMVVSPDGSKVAFTFASGNGGDSSPLRIEVRATSDGARIASFAANPFGDIAWHPDGESLLAFDTETRELRSFDLAKPGEPGVSLLRAMVTGRRIAFHPDGRTLAWADNSGFLHLHDTWLGLPIMHAPAAALHLGFSTDGRRLAYFPDSTAAAIAEIVDSPIFAQRRAPRGERTVDRELAVSPDGRWLATAELMGISLWRASDLRHVWQGVAFKTRAGILGLSFSGDSRQVRFHSSNKGRSLWDIAEGADGSARLIVPSADAPPSPHLLLATSANERWEITRTTDQTGAHFHLWRDGKTVKALAHADFAALDRYSARVSPDGKWWAYGGARIGATGENGQIVVEGAESDIGRHVLSERPCYAWLATSPDGRWLLGGADRDFVVWETGTWREVFRLPADLSDTVLGSAEFSPDGKLLALEVDHGHIRLLRPGTWEEILTITPPQDLPLTRMAFTPDSRHLYTTGGQILSRWDLQALRGELEKLGLGW